MSHSDTEYLDALRKRYRHATKKQRGKILDEYTQTTGCHRKHAIAVLRGKRARAPQPIRHPRAVIYRAEDARALETLSDLFDGINAKLLRAAMNTELTHLYEVGFLHISPECYERLKTISPATIYRLRAQHGYVHSRSPSHTKPGSLLKSQIQVRTWADWNEDRPGFVEMDLVAHDGGIARGEFAWTLNFTDIKTAWTECAAVRNKAQKHVFEGIRLVRSRLPFPLFGVDSDNGSEFINNEFMRYCESEHLTFTRSRAGHKNDNAHVEQKNWSIVRRFVGGLRFDQPAQLHRLNRLYELLHGYINFFMPSVKLVRKERAGSRVKRIYDQPQTPYARVLVSPDVSDAVKAQLRATYAELDLVELRRQLDQMIYELWDDANRS